MNVLKCSFEGSFDAEKKEAVVLVRVPCSSSEMAEEATMAFGKMFAEAVQKALEKSGKKLVSTTIVETEARSE